MRRLSGLVLLVLAACAPGLQAMAATVPLPEVNPPRTDDEALAPHMYRFVQALELHGFHVVPQAQPDRCELAVDLETNALSIDIVATLTQGGFVLVRTPVNVKTVRNLPGFRKSALSDAAELAANRFSHDLATYVRTLEAQPRPAPTAPPAVAATPAN